MGTTEDIDRFWLQGLLKIMPKEQIEFWQRLYRGNLPFSRRTMNLVRHSGLLRQTWGTAPQCWRDRDLLIS